MDRALYIAMTGAKHNMLAQTSNANNLANVNTTGFKSDFAQARAMSVFGPYYPTRAYSMTERPASDLNMGPLVETGRDLDFAIKGQGWLAVQTPDGTEAYTRRGDLIVDANGLLRTANGLQVLGEGGPIAIPPAEKIELSDDGSISIRTAGDAPEVIAQVDRLRLVNPDPQQMEKGEDGLFRVRDLPPGQPVALDPNVQIVSGFTEGSNVNAVAALTQTLSLTRQYEVQVKLMKTVDENAQATQSVIRMN